MCFFLDDFVLVHSNVGALLNYKYARASNLCAFQILAVEIWKVERETNEQNLSKASVERTYHYY